LAGIEAEALKAALSGYLATLAAISRAAFPPSLFMNASSAELTLPA
jgi:hypothetical protein